MHERNQYWKYTDDDRDSDHYLDFGSQNHLWCHPLACWTSQYSQWRNSTVSDLLLRSVRCIDGWGSYQNMWWNLSLSLTSL